MLKSSEQERFQRLTYPWRDRVYAVALRQAHLAHLAEDWVQETFLRAWKSFNQLTEEVAIYAWLLKILDRVIFDDIRRNSRRHQLAPVITVDDNDLMRHPCSSPEPFDSTLQQQLNEQILEAVKSLPNEFSQVILLRDIEGLTYNEVAYVLEIPKGTVMSRLSRGRRLLAHSLIKLKSSVVTVQTNKLDNGTKP